MRNDTGGRKRHNENENADFGIIFFHEVPQVAYSRTALVGTGRRYARDRTGV